LSRALRRPEAGPGGGRAGSGPGRPVDRRPGRSAHGHPSPTGAGERISVQRHSSFEHTLLGNTPPSRLGDAAVTPNDKAHLLRDLWLQTVFFVDDPDGDPRGQFPDVRWIKLREAGLWVSYGELNALADYLPDSDHIDGLGRDIVLPVLQRMRQGTSAQYRKLDFTGQATSGAWEHIEAVATEKALDAATEGLGPQRYFGLLSRNACHFAPYSWHRWAHFHEEAIDHALAYHRGKSETAPVKDIDTDAEEHLRQAWLNNGYGDHFLQDSFAAGHLINKTLVMQWFVDYVNGLASKWWDLTFRMWWGDDTKPWYGMPDDDVMATMGTAQQPGMAGQNLYKPPTEGGGTRSMDRALGETVTDPQSNWERGSHGQRVAGSGVNATTSFTKEQNYQHYLAFLNSAFLNLAAGMTHDHFNSQGLNVGNERGDCMQVGGDNTLLTNSGRLGATVAAEAAQASQQAIDDIIRTGTTSHTVDSLAALWPTKVYVGEGESAEAKSLEDWHDEVLHEICVKTIFPDVVDSFNSKVARAGQPDLLPGGMVDPETPAPPLPTDMGDFELPPGDGTGVG
jgi:hypothetical protein